MHTLLAKNAEILVTMDSQRRELKNAGIYAENGIIKQVSPNEELPATADTVIDLTGQIVLPGVRQHASPSQPDPHTQLAGRAEQQSFSVAPGPIPHLGTHDRGGLPRQHAHWAGGTGPFRLHDRFDCAALSA